MHALQASVQSLRSLYIHADTDVYDVNLLQLLVEHNPQLHSITLVVTCTTPDIVLQAIAAHCQYLRKLSFPAHNGVVSDAGLVCLLQRCLHLASLELWDCSGITELSLAAMALLCSQLTTFSLPGCMCLDQCSAQQLVRRLFNLEHLNLRNCKNVPAALLVDLLQNNPQLTYVNLTSVDSVADALLALLPQFCPRLSFLCIDRCMFVTDLQMLHRCDALHMLFVKGCRAVSGAAMILLAGALNHRIQVVCSGSGVSAATVRELKGHQYLQLTM